MSDADFDRELKKRMLGCLRYINGQPLYPQYVNLVGTSIEDDTSTEEADSPIVVERHSRTSAPVASPASPDKLRM